MTAETLLPSGRRLAIAASSSGSAAAKTRASAMRSASGSNSTGASVRSKSLATSPIGSSRHLRVGLGPPLSGAHPDRRKSAILPEFDQTLARKCDRRRERRSAGRAPYRWVNAIRQKPRVHIRPVDRYARQAGQRRARLIERPDDPLLEPHPGKRLLLALARIGGEEIVELGVIFGTPDDRQRFRRAAAEEIASEARPVDQRFGGAANLLEAAKPFRQGFGEFRGARPFRFRRIRQQQPALQIGEPSGHDQIIGGKLEAHLPRLLDEGKILL